MKRAIVAVFLLLAGCEELPEPAFLYGEQLGGLEFVVIDPDGNPVLIDQHVG